MDGRCSAWERPRRSQRPIERNESNVATLLETLRALAPSQVQPAGADGADRVITVVGVPVVTVSRTDAEDYPTTDASRITNNTAPPVRRAGVTLRLGYEVDLRRVSDVAREATVRTSGVLGDPAPSVRIQELGQDDIGIEMPVLGRLAPR